MSVFANIDELAWESEFFSLSSAKLNFSSEAPLLEAASLSRYQRVQAKVPAERSDIIDGLNTLGFRLVEGEVDFSLTLDDVLIAESDSRYSCRLAVEEDIPALRDAASAAFSQSRFRTPWYQEGDSGRFYALWAEKAVLGTFDRCCLIVEDEAGQPLGFVTLRELDEQQARIGLLAAWPGRGRRGAGLALMNAAKRWCVQKELKTLYVATQMGNIAALRLYIRSGASIHSTAYWLYR
ncbi:TDP-fucosamine acetyltransferase [Leminorella grimontii]|uniref:dTDP-fucosamine acetyltransferase n=1 Tax=Leminorella grimontii TaxID=82981 RepID=A0AAV5N6P8_9GAMM|nr:dTDP-4-amino-4,6-dideoxy-D-galactose acyltransferase [Leminorella grimontii]KFC93957.1 lipopolysaccharide biosynthesis protein [Leminorella grimontii ATCC 33999 = DSM 5078]GKX57290.1 TDP-fucosamine acetyltransferase [Leminorella grimontii]VFS54742.1 TDP-fucosamine acetyltransferase [Leminorella grimontii]